MIGIRATVWHSPSRGTTVLLELRRLLRVRKGVPFKDLDRLVGKLRHAAIGIPEGRAIMGPVNIFLARKPTRIFWDRCPAVRRALQDWATLIREAAAEPTHVRELVPGPASYKGTLDAAGA